MADTIATYEDVLKRLDRFQRGRTASSPVRGGDQVLLRQAVESALREVASMRDWSFLKRQKRIELSGAVNTGTVAYDSATRIVTLTGSTWPSWAAYGQLYVDSLICDVESRTDDTHIVLKASRCPTEDLTGESYTFGRSWYPLPSDFLGLWEPMAESAWFVGAPIPLSELEQLAKWRMTTGTVQKWSIGPTPGRYNSLSLYVYPWPSADSSEDFWMKCDSRELKIPGNDAWNYAGTVSIAEDGTEVTGSGTSFRSVMEGSIIRFSLDSSKPTDIADSNPFDHQATIEEVASTESLTIALDDAPSRAYSGVGYVVSDPIDLYHSAYDAFFCCCEKNLAYSCGFEDRSSIGAAYQQSLRVAKMRDSQIKQAMKAGSPRSYPSRLKYSNAREYLGDE